MRTRTIRGWTNVNPVQKDGMDRTVIRLCGDKQHKECLSRKTCVMMKPECRMDQLRMIGKKCSMIDIPPLTGDELRKIDEILHSACQKCGRVEIVIRRSHA